MPGTLDKAALDELPDISPIEDLDNVPSFDELTAAFASTRENKAPGSCGIPAEVCKHGGKRLQEKLHELIADIWRKEQMPQNWKDAIIVPIFKKGSRKKLRQLQRHIAIVNCWENFGTYHPQSY